MLTRTIFAKLKSRKHFQSHRFGKARELLRLAGNEGQCYSISSIEEGYELDRIINAVPKDKPYNKWNKVHQLATDGLLKVLLHAKNLQEFRGLAKYYKESTNVYMFNYVYEIALLNRDDTQDEVLPSTLMLEPEKLIGRKPFWQLIRQLNLLPDKRETVTLPRHYTAISTDKEEALSYFREDIGLNMHYQQWHRIYPTGNGNWDKRVIDKDRRGELFFYMHNQLVARYNVERLCNNLDRAEPLCVEENASIKEGYFPKLDLFQVGSTLPSRWPNAILQDLNWPHNKMKVETLVKWKKNIFDAIENGYAKTPKDKKVQLIDDHGANILGNITEANALSINRSLYGNLHSMAHNIISLIHNPDGIYNEDAGVLGDYITALRDPVFFRWQTFVDSIYRKYNKTLEPYTEMDLCFPGIIVREVEVITEPADGGSAAPNTFLTYWKADHIGLTAGPLLKSRYTEPVPVMYNHLDHEPFEYRFQVINTGETRKGTCRIFMTPEHDNAGHTMFLKEQSLYMIEMDKFTVHLVPGKNNFRRKSTSSSVTTSFDILFRGALAKDGYINDWKISNCDTCCVCGFPNYLLVPKGTSDGFPMHLFVMISNYECDKVECGDQLISNMASVCGLRNRKYPDIRAMGFPFERMPADDVRTLQDFCAPNMKIFDVTVQFIGEDC